MMRKLVAEGLGTGMLLMSVVGSGVMAESLAQGNTALALLANAMATGCMLYVIITVLGPVSGAHFNPVVTLAFAWRGEHPVAQIAPYMAAQISGALIGVWAVHLMFDLPIFQVSSTIRSGLGQASSEVFATFGLLFVVIGGLCSRPQAVPTLVALYITGAYWFTASTSFANPVVTLARGFSDTFAGIAPGDMPLFIAMQLLGLTISLAVLGRLFPSDQGRCA